MNSNPRRIQSPSGNYRNVENTPATTASASHLGNGIAVDDLKKAGRF